MCSKGYSLVIILLLSSYIYTSAICQETIEQRPYRIEVKQDTLQDRLKDDSGQHVSTETKSPNVYLIIRDRLNLFWGIKSDTGKLMDKKYFVINHNDSWKIPYWVAYYLSASNLKGKTRRTRDFRPDPELPIGSRSELEDYRHSGYDRGHNAPPAAFQRNTDAMSATFLLSNISPLTPSLNRNIWRILEEQIRDMVMKEGEAWIITGNLFLTLDSQFVSPHEFIGPGKVAVPTHLFKVILSKNMKEIYSMYAFLLPNWQDHIPGKPADYRITVDRLEEITGYDFFPELSDDIENRLES